MKPMQIKLFVLSLILHCLHGCFSKASESVDEKSDDVGGGNLFREHLVKRFKEKKKFEPPEEVLYGFHPVNVLSTYLDSVPGSFKI